MKPTLISLRFIRSAYGWRWTNPHAAGDEGVGLWEQ
jgi:hypothetical protein